MMGSRDPQKQLWNYQVNLDKRVRSDHPLRRIDEALKLDFVRGEVARFYGRKGNVSEDPVVIVKMMILLFLDDVRSERELMRIIPERLDYMWFLGYGLDDAIPNHSVLSKARGRWGQELFDTLFYRVVTQWVEAGLVDGSKIHVDSSLIDAKASTNSVRTINPAMREKIQQACREQSGKLDERLAQDQAEDRDDDDDDPSADEASIGINQKLRSSTDPEATLCRQSGLKSRPRYKNHRVVDDAHEIITAVKTTTGVVNEAHELMGLIEEHDANTTRAAETIVADCKYGTTQNYVACQERKLRTHMADLLKHQDNKGRREGIYPDSEFRYQPQSNTYLCPANEVMRPRRLHSVRLTWEYVTKKGVCLSCRLRELCTRSKTGRTIKRHRDQKLLERARRQANTQRAKLDRKRRQHLIERSFADAANRHGFKRARWRGLVKQSIQDLLIATIQNLRKLVATLQKNPENVSPSLINSFDRALSLLRTLIKQTPRIQNAF